MRNIWQFWPTKFPLHGRKRKIQQSSNYLQVGKWQFKL